MIEDIVHRLDRLIQQAEVHELRSLVYLLHLALMEAHEELGWTFKPSE